MAKKCPLCGVDNKPTARFCGTCGSSLPKEPEPDDDRPRSLPARLAIGCVALFCECFPGLFSPLVVAMSLLLVVVGVALIVMAGALFAMGGMFAAFMVGALGVMAYWTACVWVIAGYLCMPSEGLADIQGVQWWAFFLVGFGPFLAALALMGST
jgi:hypothetical protein